jgi:riboflavin kinase/FMN adenylyltransferase
MHHYHSLEDIQLQNAWLTIGVFDGVHRGHQEILQTLVTGAHAAGSPAVVLTFHPHPAIVLGGKTAFPGLTTPDERSELLESSGVDTIITQEFTPEFANQTADEFMRRISRTLGLHYLIIGYDTALGRGREGNASRLTEIGKQLGYFVQIVPPLKDEVGVISSTRIRQAVASGDIAAVTAGLGRNYSLAGPVVHGDGRGHTLDFPTANIEVPPEKLIPANGIYVTWAWVEGKRYESVTSIGIRPTFEYAVPMRKVETYIMDSYHELYERDIKIEFVERLRDELKFSSVDALVAQIRTDVENARKILIPRSD